MISTHVNNIIATQFGKSPDSIKASNHLVNDLGADSLDLVELVMKIEAQFKISIEESEYQNAYTVDLITQLVESKLLLKNNTTS
jgi:acyl carrier protein